MRAIIIVIFAIFFNIVAQSPDECAAIIRKKFPFQRPEIGKQIEIILNNGIKISGELTEISQKYISIRDGNFRSKFSYQKLSDKTKRKIYFHDYEKWISAESIRISQRLESMKKAKIEQEAADKMMKDAAIARKALKSIQRDFYCVRVLQTFDNYILARPGYSDDIVIIQDLNTSKIVDDQGLANLRIRDGVEEKIELTNAPVPSSTYSTPVRGVYNRLPGKRDEMKFRCYRIGKKSYISVSGKRTVPLYTADENVARKILGIK